VSAPALHPRHGPHRPAAATLPRADNSVRRTATTDMLRPQGLTGPLVLRGRARDLLTRGGDQRTLGQASMEAVVDYMGERRLAAISTDPPVPGLGALVGTIVASGFRASVERLLPVLGSSTPLHLLVDDLPVTTLVSGYALSHAGAAHPRAGQASARPDICAGWRSGGTIMLGIERSGRVPVVTGPPAPPLPDPLDPAGWHELEPMAPQSMRRWRRLDVTAGNPIAVDAMFRDSHADADGRETVVHEYSLAASVDPASGRITDIEADPRVLPWVECPAAAGSAAALAGQHVRDLRAWVRVHLSGVLTCTHLNDMLRSLADIAALMDTLPAAGGQGPRP
jgi:Protein of unknown function (DUF2889)